MGEERGVGIIDTFAGKWVVTARHAPSAAEPIAIAIKNKLRAFIGDQDI
jgi:hypothetical protein